jgi:hypothetical protein
VAFRNRGKFAAAAPRARSAAAAPVSSSMDLVYLDINDWHRYLMFGH